jgi:hypothetical protein
MIPRTQVGFHRDQLWNWEGLNNKFHLSGAGAHLNMATRVLFFKNFFIQTEAKATAVKINNALVDGSSARLKQSPIISLQTIATVGYRYVFKAKK